MKIPSRSLDGLEESVLVVKPTILVEGAEELPPGRCEDCVADLDVLPDVVPPFEGPPVPLLLLLPPFAVFELEEPKQKFIDKNLIKYHKKQ